MPSKKQRRRAEKARRHEYEYVLLDEDGNEVPIDDPAEPRKTDEAKQSVRRGRGGPRPARPARTVQPPSWQRVAKRGLMFAPVMFLMVTIIDPKVSTAGKVTNTLLLLAFFLPFSYLMDTFAYKTYRKRTDRADT